MNDNNLDNDKTDELLLKLIEKGSSITEEELAQLSGNEDLMRDCQDLMDIKTVMSKENTSDTTEKKLRAFKQTMSLHYSAPSHQYFYRITIAFFLAAALIGLIFVLKPDNPVSKPMTPNITYVTQDRGATARIYSHTTSLRKGKTVLTANSRCYDFEQIKGYKADTICIRFKVPNGNNATLTLPDGSKVYLHPGATLIFPAKFTDKYREVQLQGEAYFAVRHNTRQPFVVTSGKIRTTVLGTEFDVNTEGTLGTEVSLIKGKVSVTINRSKPIIITPGQQAYTNKGNLKLRPINTDSYEAWRDGYLLFDDMPIHDIILAIGHIYGMPVHFLSNNHLQERMRFMTDLNSSLNNTIEMMNNMKKVKIRYTAKEIIVE